MGVRAEAALALRGLCCWGARSPSDTSSEKQQSRRTTVRHEPGGSAAAPPAGSSAASLHLPGPSGSKPEPPPAHRSHEDIGRRRSQPELAAGRSALHHSAPSVIHEVLHRRDWERAPLAPPARDHSDIEFSKRHGETRPEEDKDRDATEASSFYIGDNDALAALHRAEEAKEAKRTLNESIRCKERARPPPAPLHELRARSFGFRLDDVIGRLHAPDRASAARSQDPPPSAEPAGCEGGARYLWASACPPPGPGSLRGRHASDGDILAPPLRPESGAFSESDLDAELEPPAHRGKETAI